jgi:DNA-binding CsgD family transcriptional regulator/DNA-binding Lrp family transcriptional regulator
VAVSPAQTPELSPLGVLGFSGLEERLYRLILRNSGHTLAELAPLAGLPIGELREQVTRFVGLGVLELQGEVVVPRPPEEALGRLLSEEVRRVRSRGEQLDAVRGLLSSLQADHLAATAPTGEAVEIERLQSSDDVVAVIRSLSAASSGDLLWMRPDPWNVASGEQLDLWVTDLIASGRRSRAIYQVDVLRNAPGTLRRRVEAGEHVRLLAEVPTRMAVFGTSAAVIVEQFHVFDDRRLVLRQPSLISAMTLLFEGLWEKAMPVPGLDAHREVRGASAQRLLLTQLAGGAKDEQIARALDLSVRTVRRRVSDVMDELGATSRFQAGVEAVRRGWL